jgi:hypothetical protein
MAWVNVRHSIMCPRGGTLVGWSSSGCPARIGIVAMQKKIMARYMTLHAMNVGLSPSELVCPLSVEAQQ